MIGNISKNDSFDETVAYVVEKDGAVLLGGNLAGRSAIELAAELGISRSLNPARKPVYHVSLSLPPGEDLSDRQFLRLARRYLKGMDINPTEHQYLVARHTDQEHAHIHIVVSRINVRTGRLADSSFDYYRSQAVIRALEEEFRLSPTLSSWEKQPEQEQPEQQGDRLVELEHEELRRQIQAVLETEPQNFSELAARLLDNGVAVTMIPPGAEQIAGGGISYRLAGSRRFTPGSKLGHSFPALLRRGLKYSPLDGLKIARYNRQVLHLKRIVPIAAKVWALLKTLDVPLIDGNNYRFVVVKGQNSSQLQVSRKQGETLLPILNLSSDQEDQGKITFSIENSFANSKDEAVFTNRMPQLKELIQLHEEGKTDSRTTRDKLVTELLQL